MADKRDNGSGTIYQRENGTWVGRIYIGKNAEGKPKYKCFSGKTQTEVKRKIKEYNQSGNKSNITKISVEEYLTNWMKLYKRGTIKESSYDTIERTFKNYVKDRIGMIQLQKLTSNDIQKLLQDLKKEGYSYSTIKKVYDLFHESMDFALKRKDISDNPMWTVKMLSSDVFEKKEIRFFNKAECALICEEALREYSTGRRVYIYGDAFILVLNTGLRLGELVGLEKTDWNREDKTLHVRRNIQRLTKRDEEGNAIKGRVLTTGTTKSYSSDRILPLNKNATEALERLCAAYPESKYIVCSTKGDLVPHERMERTFHYLLKNCKIDMAGMHSLRHTFASMLFASGKNIKRISKLMGHASIQITMNTYIHLFEEIDHDAVAALDDVF